jgi:isocitrate lyase
MLVRIRFSIPITVLGTRNALTIRAFGERTMASSALPLDPVSIDEETKIFEQRCSDMQEFFMRPRFAGIKRPYTASDVVSKQGSFPPVPLPGSLLSDKLFALFSRASKEGKPVHTMGAIDPVQVTQMARYQEVVYVSGWAASSVLTTANNEVGPDLS